MSNVISLMDALPPRVVDERLAKMREQFGTRPFRPSEIKGVDPILAWDWCLYHPLSDSLSTVEALTGGTFRLVPTPPTQAALPRWKEQYLPILDGLGHEIRVAAFAEAAHLPVPSALYVLHLFVKEGLLFARRSDQDSFAVFFRPQAAEIRRKVIRRRRRVIWAMPPDPHGIYYPGA